MTEQEKAKGAPRGPGSFCIPKAAIAALLDAQATAYEICTYLVLARHTDESGRYSPASISAVNKATGANKTRGGPVDRAIQRLKTIRATVQRESSNGKSGKARKIERVSTSIGPILYDRETWIKETGDVVPDGPISLGEIRYVLPDFGEPLNERIWFGSNLLSGFEGFEKPLKALKNAGDEAARLLLVFYLANDMESWSGANPLSPGYAPWRRYEPVAEDCSLRGGGRLIRAKHRGAVARIDKRVASNDEAYWSAIEALESIGLIYEIVMVLNRNATPSQFSGSGEKYGQIPNDAEPYYQLDARTEHGYKPKGEEGIGGVTAKTASDLGYPVTVSGGRFDGTYAAIVRRGQGAMIAGIFRLRCRVANPLNAGVKGAWARIHQNDREAFELVQAIRAANDKPPIVSPLEPKPEADAPNPDPDEMLMGDFTDNMLRH